MVGVCIFNLVTITQPPFSFRQAIQCYLSGSSSTAHIITFNHVSSAEYNVFILHINKFIS